MGELLVHVLYHNAKQKIKANHLDYCNLNDLPFDPSLAENRFFLSDIHIQSEYIGIASASWNDKYPTSIKLENLNDLSFEESIVYAPDLSNKFWLLDSEKVHPGMFKILILLSEKFNLDISKSTLWANNFICHKKVFKDFLSFWKEAYNFCIEEKLFNYHVGAENMHRHAAYLGERLTCLYFSSRKDLEIKSTCNPPFIRSLHPVDLEP